MTADNRLVMSGRVYRLDPPRRSPAGLPIIRFVLEHSSQQTEAGHNREARLRLAAVAAGDALAHQMRPVSTGSSVRVQGFLARSSTRSGDYRLVLHAQSVTLLDAPAA